MQWQHQFEGHPIAGLFVLALLAGLYFLPSLVAFIRGRRNAGAILLLNLLLGWTFVGWAVALVWSVTTPER